MSGGSFDYLYLKDIINKDTVESLKEMLKEVLEVDGGSKAATSMALLIAYTTTIEQKFHELQEVMQAVEWYKSCDWGLDQVQEAIKKYEKEH